MASTPDSLDAVLTQEPTLNIYGFGLGDSGRRLSPSGRRLMLISLRAELSDRQTEVKRTCEWIRARLTPQKTINRRHSSYGLKHCAATDIGYLQNGVFIAAMLLCGYRHEHRDGPNATFNVSEHSITHAHAPHVAQGTPCL